jgi:diguanylate cyclase (GGDEF)-like protein/PAS domain S-box-containing protein
MDEGQLRDLFENAVDIIYAHDLEGNLTELNKAGERLTGFRREEALRMKIQDMLDPKSRELVMEMIRRELGGGQRSILEVGLITKDGRRLALEVGTQLVFRAGVPVAVQGIARDITERKRFEALERDRNRVLELTAGNVPLDRILGGLCGLIEGQCPELRCAAVVWRNGRLALGAAPNLPAGFEESWAAPDISGAAGAYAAQFDESGPVRMALDVEPALRSHGDLLSGAGLRTCWVLPILSGDGKRLGAILLYAQEDWAPGPSQLQVLRAGQRLATVAIEHVQLTDQLAYQARHDSLTGLPNRFLFNERLEQALHNARRHNWLLAVLFLDLDRFKEINDTLGHPMGDLTLGQVARRLEAALRKSDSLARLGGDEFGLVLTEPSDAQDALRVARKLLDALEGPFTVLAREIFLTASIGISLYPRDGQDGATLERKADAAMYRAKNRGRNRAEFFTSDLGVAALERMEIENALRRALENGELQLYYQPEVDASGSLVGLEALLVWNHPRLGATSPQRFIPVAEESGMIVPIGAWVLAQACLQHAAWLRAGAVNVKMAVNVSAAQFSRPDFVETVAQALAESGLTPSLLELELTESMVMRDLDESARQMDRLRALGVSISIDDFGTGYSSLGYLWRLPIDTLKIDRSFLEDIDRDANTIPLVQAIVTLAHGLGLRVVAEGIETQSQMEVLRNAGCEIFQGFLLGEPRPPEAIERLLAEAGLMLR